MKVLMESFVPLQAFNLQQLLPEALLGMYGHLAITVEAIAGIQPVPMHLPEAIR